jgi:hypothetical protein
MSIKADRIEYLAFDVEDSVAEPLIKAFGEIVGLWMWRRRTF